MIAALFIALVGLEILQTTYYSRIYCFETVCVTSICAFNVVSLSRHPHQTEQYAVVVPLGRNFARGKAMTRHSNAFVLITVCGSPSSVELLESNHNLKLGGKKGAKK
jgi:hypothetical protein